MTMQQGLEVHGYQPQSQDRVAIVNGNKLTEEMLLRRIESLTKDGVADPRWAAIAKTDLERGFMALNRAVFQPSRVKLPGDPE
jgi:hypothetical protein